MSIYFERLVSRYPDLEECMADIHAVHQHLSRAFNQGGQLLICGNGGSAADSEHLVGELMKGFLHRRPVPAVTRQALKAVDPELSDYLADHLQGALPALSLVSQTALITAYANDVAADMIFAQQVYGYGRPGDVLLGISTSGNSRNVINALKVARALRLTTIGITGQRGGAMKDVCDVTVRVPWNETADIQERHLAIYHALCAQLEQDFFPHA